MLTKLLIKNFQAHRNLRIDLDERITTIVGQSDVGKSAIIRALKWICTNTPTGNSFVRGGKGSVHVKLSVDGNSISRRKAKGLNSYVINGDDLRAFKSRVPNKVAKVLNVDPINFQDQHNAPFWFSLTPNKVSKELNRIVNLEAIDKAQSNIASKLRKANTVVEVVRERLKGAKSRAAELTYVPELNKDLKHLEAMEKQLSKLQEQRLAVVDLVKAIQAHTVRIESFGSVIAKARASVKTLDTIASKLDTLQHQKDCLGTLIRNLEKETEQWEANKTNLERARRKLRKINRGKCPVCGKKMSLP